MRIAGATALATRRRRQEVLDEPDGLPGGARHLHGREREVRATLDDDELSYELSYSGIEGGTAVAAHIHFGQRSVNGGVSAFLCGGGDKPPCPATAGTVTGVIDPADVIGPAGQGIAPGEFDELISAMRAGLTYANVHSDPMYLGGEIRGQIKRG